MFIVTISKTANPQDKQCCSVVQFRNESRPSLSYYFSWWREAQLQWASPDWWCGGWWEQTRLYCVLSCWCSQGNRSHSGWFVSPSHQKSFPPPSTPTNQHQHHHHHYDGGVLFNSEPSLILSMLCRLSAFPWFSMRFTWEQWSSWQIQWPPLLTPLSPSCPWSPSVSTGQFRVSSHFSLKILELDPIHSP